MADLSEFDVNSAGNPNNNIFGLPFTEEDARLIILPVPWEVTVSSGAGTSRSMEQLFKASLQVDIFDVNIPDAWKQGYYMPEINKKILMKSDYLRKEAELYIDFTTKGNQVSDNKFMCKSLREINEGSVFMNNWVYEQTSSFINDGKLIGLLGGDHSTPFGYIKALAEKHGEFGILQIDAHCDLRKAFEHFHYSHASIMYNVMEEIPQVNKLVQLGIRDYCDEEYQYIQNSNGKIVTFFDQDVKERQFEGETWKQLTADIIKALPDKVYLSFDIDGLDPKLCPNTGTPVPGGFEVDQVLYLIKSMLDKGKQLIGFDLVEIGIGENCIDANVGARVLWRLCNQLIKSNS
ncbi:MAG: agmatinase family protein [Ilyomonas sp.]